MNSQLMFFLILVLDLFCQVVSEYCGSDKYCEVPYHCCGNFECCYNHHGNARYTRGFRLHVWNMWYFWLVIIFILMSCFGGCGYYRKRRMAAMQNCFTSTESAREVCASRTRRRPPLPALYTYAGPAVPAAASVQLPPPYTEVMQQPSLYPVNKAELPPYPGPPGNKGHSQGSHGGAEPCPPSYYEVVSLPPLHSQPGGSSTPADHIAVAMDTGIQEDFGRSSEVQGDRAPQAAGRS